MSDHRDTLARLVEKVALAIVAAAAVAPIDEGRDEVLDIRDAFNELRAALSAHQGPTPEDCFSVLAALVHAVANEVDTDDVGNELGRAMLDAQDALKAAGARSVQSVPSGPSPEAIEAALRCVPKWWRSPEGEPQT